MKHKIKEIDFNRLNYIYSIDSNNGMGNTNCKLINFTYNGEELEFQTPKVIIEKLIKENNKEYLLLRIIGNQACKTFCTKILEMEEAHNNKLSVNTNWFNNKLQTNNIKSVFQNDCFIVKIPFKYSKPCIKIYTTDSNLFNYYHLKQGMEIICLLSSNNLWINFDNSVTYNLIVKEILVTKHT